MLYMGVVLSIQVYKNQSFISDAVENIITKQDDIEGSVSTMKDQVSIYDCIHFSA